MLANTSLKTIQFSEQLKTIGSSSFFKCSSLETLSLPPMIYELGPFVFSFCTSLKNITIPDSVETIGSKVFSSCDRLYTIYYYLSNEFTSNLIPGPIVDEIDIFLT